MSLNILAKEMDEAFLFIGRDFIHTDIRPVKF
jgi:uncharacterized protein with PIN domain